MTIKQLLAFLALGLFTQSLVQAFTFEDEEEGEEMNYEDYEHGDEGDDY